LRGGGGGGGEEGLNLLLEEGVMLLHLSLSLSLSLFSLNFMIKPRQEKTWRIYGSQSVPGLVPEP